MSKKFAPPFITEKILNITLKSINKDITESYVHTWVDRKGKPYKYEFNEKFQTYLNPEEIKVKYR